MEYETVIYIKNYSIYKGKVISDDQLEEIEPVEDDDGEIRKRFIFKGWECGPIFVAPKVLKQKYVPYGTIFSSGSGCYATGCTAIYTVPLYSYVYTVTYPTTYTATDYIQWRPFTR